MKRFLSLLLALSLILCMIPGVSAQEAPQSVDRCCSTLRPGARAALNRPQYDGKLYEISHQRVEDTFRYLDEMYVQKYPEAAVTVNDMDEDDRQVLRTLARIITEGCTTDREKADAVAAWVGRNIQYDVNASAYANDTFYNRIGNCLSYAMLIQTLLRLLEIPAVWGDGWRGDLKESTVELFNYEGHAWCFVYLEEEWVLYDPLWLSEGTTDREYIAQWIWLDTVECVTPAYDPENLPPEAYDKPKVYYTDGSFRGFSDSNPEGFGNQTSFVNNMTFNFTPCQDEPDGSGFDGWEYLDDAANETLMSKGEVYRNGWISYGEYHNQRHLHVTYTHFNGMQIDGSVMELDGVDRLVEANTSMEILVDADVYSICYGTFTLPIGYTGPFLKVPWGDNIEDTVVKWESQNPEIATVDQQGNVTCLSEGFAQFWLTLTGQEDGALLSFTTMEIYVAGETRVPDYTDHSPQEPDDGKLNISDFTDLEANAYYLEPVAWAVETGVTTGTSATTFAPGDPCKRSQVVTFLWRAQGEPDPVSEETAFSDVEPGMFYTVPVAWAVENGVTNGLRDGYFGVNEVCTRAQVVTFLWRTAGKPKPVTTQCEFTDVEPGSFYYDAVLWATETGVTNGVGDGLFGVNKDCTRAQVVTFLWRYIHK